MSLLRICALLAVILIAVPCWGGGTLAEFAGTDFRGGAASIFGSIMAGEININYVYARSTGAPSSMQAAFDLPREPEGQVFIHIKGRDDDGPDQCKIDIKVNDTVVFSGANDFSAEGWQVRKLAIPAGTLKVGENTVTISNTHAEGRLGMPPWFQIARCAIADGEYSFGPTITEEFNINLPEKVRPFPEPLKAGGKPGFRIRGMKGWLWKSEQYLTEIPVLAKYGGNFLMNCYGSMCDIEHQDRNPEVNRWWEDLPAEKKAAYEEVVRKCREYDIQFCFSMNPGVWTKRPLDYNSAQDLEDLYKHYAWMQGLGVKWFNISLDDISKGVDPSGQSKVVNEIYSRLKAKDPEAKMLFCPTIYRGDGTPEGEREYLETLAKELDEDVYLFWTGNGVLGSITRGAAESFKRISGHRLFLWDNYPVNDGAPTMHLGPVIGRDSDLCEVIDGYMSNPLHSQTEANCIPLLTCLDYACNPYSYDPERSICQAIMHLEPEPENRELIRRLVEMYPGFLISGRVRTGDNPIRHNFARILEMSHARWIAEGHLRNLESFADSMDKAFPTRYAPARQTLRDDIAACRGMFKERYGE